MEEKKDQEQEEEEAKSLQDKREPGPEKSSEEAGEGRQEAMELKDRLMRLAAEFDNYKKRTAKDLENSKAHGRADVIAKLLPTIDEFELALETLDKKDEKSKGIALIYANLFSTLKSIGLKEIDSKGVFDPYRHEIILAEESKEKEGTILEVVRKGYMLNDIMLRPASVIIAKEAAKAGEKENKEQ